MRGETKAAMQRKEQSGAGGWVLLSIFLAALFLAEPQTAEAQFTVPGLSGLIDSSNINLTGNSPANSPVQPPNVVLNSGLLPSPPPPSRVSSLPPPPPLSPPPPSPPSPSPLSPSPPSPSPPSPPPPRVSSQSPPPAATVQPSPRASPPPPPPDAEAASPPASGVGSGNGSGTNSSGITTPGGVTSGASTPPPGGLVGIPSLGSMPPPQQSTPSAPSPPPPPQQQAVQSPPPTQIQPQPMPPEPPPPSPSSRGTSSGSGDGGAGDATPPSGGSSVPGLISTPGLFSSGPPAGAPPPPTTRASPPPAQPPQSPVPDPTAGGTTGTTRASPPPAQPPQSPAPNPTAGGTTGTAPTTQQPPPPGTAGLSAAAVVSPVRVSPPPSQSPPPPAQIQPPAAAAPLSFSATPLGNLTQGTTPGVGSQLPGSSNQGNASSGSETGGPVQSPVPAQTAASPPPLPPVQTPSPTILASPPLPEASSPTVDSTAGDSAAASRTPQAQPEAGVVSRSPPPAVAQPPVLQSSPPPPQETVATSPTPSVLPTVSAQAPGVASNTPGLTASPPAYATARSPAAASPPPATSREEVASRAPAASPEVATVAPPTVATPPATNSTSGSSAVRTPGVTSEAPARAPSTQPAAILGAAPPETGNSSPPPAAPPPVPVASPPPPPPARAVSQPAEQPVVGTQTLAPSGLLVLPPGSGSSLGDSQGISQTPQGVSPGVGVPVGRDLGQPPEGEISQLRIVPSPAEIFTAPVEAVSNNSAPVSTFSLAAEAPAPSSVTVRTGTPNPAFASPSQGEPWPAPAPETNVNDSIAPTPVATAGASQATASAASSPPVQAPTPAAAASRQEFREPTPAPRQPSSEAPAPVDRSGVLTLPADQEREAPAPAPVSTEETVSQSRPAPAPVPNSGVVTAIRPSAAPAPQAPRVVPSQAPAPAPSSGRTPTFGPARIPASVPVPQTAPRAAPVPAPAPSSGRTPTFGPARILASVPVPQTAPRAAPVPAPVPSSGRTPTFGPARIPASAPVPQTAPRAAPVPAPAAISVPVPLPFTAPTPAPAPSERLPLLPVPAPDTVLVPSPEEDALLSAFSTSPPTQSSSPPLIAPSPLYSFAPLSALGNDPLVFSSGPAIAPAPGLASWMIGAEQLAPNLFYVSNSTMNGFYTVTQSSDGTLTQTPAFQSVPAGANTSTWSESGVQLLLQGDDLLPFNETYQAALLNQIGGAFKQAGVPYILDYEGAGVVSVMQPPASGRHLLQSGTNADNITSNLGVNTAQNVRVNLTVSVPFQDRNNVTAIVQSAINSGQVARGLLEAGVPVQNAQVVAVNSISPGTNPDLTPSPPTNNATPTSSSSGGVSGAVIGGAVGGGCVGVILLAFIAYKVHTRRRKKRRDLDLEASKATKMDASDDENGDAYFGANGNGHAQVYADGHKKHPHEAANGYTSSSEQSGEARPKFIKTIYKQGSQDVALLSVNGPPSSMGSPYAQSVAARSGHDSHSGSTPLEAMDPHLQLIHNNKHQYADNAEYEESRKIILASIEQAERRRPGNSNRIDANLWQVAWSDMHMQKQIGEGSFGKVYLAKWRETTVAVKVLTGGNIHDDDVSGEIAIPKTVLLALQKEAGMMAALRHPNVVMYLGVCMHPPAVVTEYCARGSLNDVLKKCLTKPELAGQLDWSRRLGMALDAAKGMHYLHSSDPPVIHRDLKSPNLLVDKHWRVKVCDFNLSRVLEESSVLSSIAASNPRWLAPEILSGNGYTFSSDVYSFGVILWEFLTWRVPWHECGPWQVVAMVTEQSMRPELPTADMLPGGSFAGYDEYVELMHSCWHQDAEKRLKFQDIIEVLRRLMANEMTNRRNANNIRRSSTLSSQNSGDVLKSGDIDHVQSSNADTQTGTGSSSSSARP